MTDLSAGRDRDLGVGLGEGLGLGPDELELGEGLVPDAPGEAVLPGVADAEPGAAGM
jgi:hypothetical protein